MSAPIAGPIPITFASRQALFSGINGGAADALFPGTNDVQTIVDSASALATVDRCLIEGVTVGINGADTDLVFLENDGTTVLWTHLIDASSIDTPYTISFGQRGIILNEGFSIQLLDPATGLNSNQTSLYIQYRIIYP